MLAASQATTQRLAPRLTLARVAPEELARSLFDASLDQLNQRFDEAYRRLDHVNALALFGQLSEYWYQDVVARPAYNQWLTPIISTFAPKSGGTFLHNRMMTLGYQEFWWTMVDPRCHSWCYTSPRALELYGTGGLACHTHARPHANLLTALDRAGHERIWLHLRNPAECVVSAWHHMQGEGHGTGAVGDERRDQAAQQAEVIGTNTQDLTRFVIAQIDWFIEWTTEWLAYATDHHDAVVVSYYDEMGDPNALFERVFAELGARLPHTVDATPLPHDRIRRKTTKSWRDGLSTSVVEFVERRLRDALERFDSFDRLWT